MVRQNLGIVRACLDAFNERDIDAAFSHLAAEFAEKWGSMTFTIRDGAIQRICMYREHDEALEAAGMSD